MRAKLRIQFLLEPRPLDPGSLHIIIDVLDSCDRQQAQLFEAGDKRRRSTQAEAWTNLANERWPVEGRR